MSYISSINKAWKVAPFGKVVRRSQYGLSESATEDGVPYLKMSNIRDGKVIVEGADRLKVDEKTLDEYALKDGDLVFNRTNSLDLVGKTGVFRGDEKVVFASYLVRFQLHDNKADSRFIAAWFASAGAAHRLRCLATPGVSQSNINPTTLRLSMHVPCPPLPEQRKIADILTTWDEALEKLDALIEAQERHKQALMQQLLTGRRRLKGFSKPWLTAKLGTLFKERVEQGRSDLPLLSITADRGIVRREDIAKRDSSSEDKSRYLRIAPGDIGYNTMRMWQGVSALSAFEGIVSPAYTICRPTERIDGRFASHFFKLRHTVHLFHRYSQGLVDDTLNLKFPSFAVIEVTIPTDLDEQRQIAALLDTADQQLTLLRKQRTSLDQQKRGLMQKLLTGKIRVKTDYHE